MPHGLPLPVTSQQQPVHNSSYFEQFLSFCKHIWQTIVIEATIELRASFRSKPLLTFFFIFLSLVMTVDQTATASIFGILFIVSLTWLQSKRPSPDPRVQKRLCLVLVIIWCGLFFGRFTMRKYIPTGTGCPEKVEVDLNCFSPTFRFLDVPDYANVSWISEDHFIVHHSTQSGRIFRIGVKCLSRLEYYEDVSVKQNDTSALTIQCPAPSAVSFPLTNFLIFSAVYSTFLAIWNRHTLKSN